ncbi:MAG: glycoside hydrolase/phage tail family protein [Cypionkella sp.]|nr:glycoside hydrolase/phage tail family protein [Cypionkella sp.]
MEIPKLAGRAVYGGTPDDRSVIEAITALKAGGQKVTFYPFVLMDQMAGNGLPDPYSDAGDQPVLPWRGRITGSAAPGQAGSPDGTSAATAQIDDFFGNAAPSQFSHSPAGVTYTGPDHQWRYRRFILHYAHLCAAAGGVDSFLIGSEMRGLTSLRGGAHSFPAVTRLRTLAAEVRAILGPNCKISYAADWSEYFGTHVDDNVYFHLDPLWADANIDYIGIDNYMPLADWRDGASHADTDWGSIYNPDYLAANIAGGEGFDWYYASLADEAAQTRTPITDGAHSEPWVFRYKDLRGWWDNLHHNRIGGVRSASPTAWLPHSKPFRFTEYGCAAIDKGANQPNRFLDPKSSESGLPKYSNGMRDDAMQLAYFTAQALYWKKAAHNPVSGIYGGKMLDFNASHAWAWDARPFPDFPQNTALWSDGENYEAGHWLNGRAGIQPLAAVIDEIAASSGVQDAQTDKAYGIVRGYIAPDPTTARAMLQPLLQAAACEVIEREGTLQFRLRALAQVTDIDPQTTVRSNEIDGTIEVTRGAVTEETGRLRLSYVEAVGNFSARVAEAIFPDDGPLNLGQSELPIVLTGEEASAIALRFMAETRLSRDTARLGLPKSMAHLGAGDILRLDNMQYRIDRSENAAFQLIEAVRSEPALFLPMRVAAKPRKYTAPVIEAPLAVQFFDLPLISGAETPHAPYVAALAAPWVGAAGVWSAPADDGYALTATLAEPAIMGATLTSMAAAQPGVWDRGPALRVELARGALSSRTIAEVLAGQNIALIGDGTPSGWEVFQFANAVLVAPGIYDLSMRLRGQAGSDGIMAQQWPVGSRFVMLNTALRQVPLPATTRGLERHYRVGLLSAGYESEDVTLQIHAFDGAGLRPYRVAHLRASLQSGDLGISWIRRTRIDGDTWQAVEVPLGETHEVYVLRIVQGGNLLREVVLGMPSFTYTAAMRALDGATGQITLSVAQQSDAYGFGPYRSINVQL